ncbi:hypothetical protein RB195_015213 [Necator americanus]|uniref:Uncharacterized protein n=1 Tax=Necator americanus TaxID=51031 RepID=A0ABR1E3I0_NECAM
MNPSLKTSWMPSVVQLLGPHPDRVERHRSLPGIPLATWVRQGDTISLKLFTSLEPWFCERHRSLFEQYQ